MMMNRRTPAYISKLAIALGCLLFCLVACGRNVGDRGDFFGTAPFASESREGLILEGEGPIPARLIYRSSNSISSEEDRLVIEAITQELDRLVDLAGRLDDAITGETTMTDHLTSERGGADGRQ